MTVCGEDGDMQTSSVDRTGILIVRLWMEATIRDGFRARITQTTDSRSPHQEMATAGTPEEVYALVRTWVEDFTNAD